jgi:hypothetical protein
MDSVILTVVILGSIITTLGIIGGVIWYEQNQKKLVNQKISDKEVIQIAREYGDKIDVAMLCERTELTAKEAKIKLKYLSEIGMLSIDWQSIFSGSPLYRLKGTKNKIFPNITKTISEATKSGKSWRQILPEIADSIFNSKSETNTPISSPNYLNKDAQIISLALENKGIVSASMVCIKLNMGIDEAQKKLEELRQKQVFITEISDNGGLLYRLLDA